MGESPATLAATIRFHLNQLSAGNGHHEFEHLARHLCRARVYSNLLPATGPVSAGGDGGRDFETFRVGLRPSQASTTKFAAATSGERTVVFACSLQMEIEAKIRADTKSILKGGAVDEVVYFCEANVPIGRRNKLKAWALSQGIDLQVFDGQAISELLADPEVFWIAQQYLRLPADLEPARHDEDDYGELRRRWRDRSPLPVSQADFLEVKRGLRRATFDADAKPDLLRWIATMEGFLGPHTPRHMLRNALYELAVAHLRGRGEMTSQLPRLEDYYSDVGNALSLAELQDATTLLVYSFGAVVRGELNIDPETLFAWRNAVAGILADQITHAPGPGRLSGLLQIRGHLETTPPDADTAPDRSVAYATWHEMITLAEKAPFFPVESFADFLEKAIAWVPDEDAVLELAARTDELLAARGGGEAGGRALSRAMVLLEHDRYVSCIRELHAAKLRWYKGGRPDGLVRVCIILAFCYRQLGLAYAGKYYALAGAFIAAHEDRPEIATQLPDAMRGVMDAEDMAGNSLSFILLFAQALEAHIHLDTNPLDADLHPWVNENLNHMAALVAYARGSQPSLEPHLEPALAHWPGMFRDAVLKAVDAPDAVWHGLEHADLRQQLRCAMVDPPFSDMGPRRQARWSALGMDWSVTFENTHETVRIAEQFLAELQLMSVACVGQDLGLVPGPVEIELVVDPTSKHVQLTPSDEALRLVVPGIGEEGSAGPDGVTAFMMLVHARSGFSERALLGLLNEAMLTDTFVARPYAELFDYFMPPPLFAEAERLGAPQAPDPSDWPLTSHPQLAWFDDLAPDYDEAEALGSIELRYARILPFLRFTLPRLNADPRMRAWIVDQHEAGRPDWEILAILMNVALNARMSFDTSQPSDEMRARGLAAIDTPETPDQALEAEAFLQADLTLARQLFLGAHLNGWKVRQPPLARFEDLELFLTTRYRFGAFDLPHEDVFGWCAPEKS